MTIHIDEYEGTSHSFSRHYRVGDNSPREGGKLRLRDNDFRYVRQNGSYPLVLAGVIVPSWAPNFGEKYETYGFQAFMGPRDYSWNEETLDGLRSEIVSDVRAKLNSTVVNLAVAFAERTQTAKMISSTVGTLTKAVEQLIAKQPKKAFQTLGLLPPKSLSGKGKKGKKAIAAFYASGTSNAWLQLSYGWGPLVADIVGAMVACDRVTRDRRHVRAHGRVFKNMERSECTQIAFGTGLGTIDATVKKDYTYRVALTWDLVVDSDIFMSAAQVGLTNPAVVAWELIPYSFVIDQMFKVGKMLTALAPLPPGTSFENVKQMRFSEERWSVYPNSTETTALVTRPNPSGGGTSTAAEGHWSAIKAGSGHSIICVRRPWSMTVLDVSLQIDNPISWNNAANDIALLTQKLLSLK